MSRCGGPGHANALGILAKDTGDLAAAEQWYDSALDLLGDVYTPDDPQLASLQHNRAGLAHARPDHVTAEAHAGRALQLRARA
ncbi:MAG TPA: tetratricopeptide repeat protein [Microlunatus sp.]